jgi:hypothetical protein
MAEQPREFLYTTTVVEAEILEDPGWHGCPWPSLAAGLRLSFS